MSSHQVRCSIKCSTMAIPSFMLFNYILRNYYFIFCCKMSIIDFILQNFRKHILIIKRAHLLKRRMNSGSYYCWKNVCSKMFMAAVMPTYFVITNGSCIPCVFFDYLERNIGISSAKARHTEVVETSSWTCEDSISCVIPSS